MWLTHHRLHRTKEHLDIDLLYTTLFSASSDPRKLGRFRESDIHESVRTPVRFHLLIPSHYGMMRKDVWVLRTFGGSERDARSTVGRSRHHQICECQRVQSDVPGATRRQMRLEVVERPTEALRVLVKRLHSVRSSDDFKFSNSTLNDTHPAVKRPKEAIDDVDERIRGRSDLVLSKVHPLVDARRVLRVGAQHVHSGPDAAPWRRHRWSGSVPRAPVAPAGHSRYRAVGVPSINVNPSAPSNVGILPYVNLAVNAPGLSGYENEGWSSSNSFSAATLRICGDYNAGRVGLVDEDKAWKDVRLWSGVANADHPKGYQ